MISIRRMSLGSGFKYLMDSIAVGDGAAQQSSGLTRYYAESGTPPGVFLGAGLGGLDNGNGVEKGSPVTEQHLFHMLGMCADPVTGEPLARQPNKSHPSQAKRVAKRVEAIPASASDAERAQQTVKIETEERSRAQHFRAPVAGFDLTFSPPQERLDRLGGSRSGDQGGDLRMPPPSH